MPRNRTPTCATPKFHQKRGRAGTKRKAHTSQKLAQYAHTVTASPVLPEAHDVRGSGAPLSSFQAYHISAQEREPVGTPLLTKFLFLAWNDCHHWKR